jgi:Fe(3+) dicitrate transport protein
MVMEDANGNSYNYRTNTGNSATDGLEVFAELALSRRAKKVSVHVFTSTAWMNARYTKATFASAGKNYDISGNRLESAPVWTSRNGVRVGWRSLNFSVQYSYVGASFSDPLNTGIPATNGSRGPVPSYGLWDTDLSLQLHPQIKFLCGINNVTNISYFSKRPVFYPDPGIWPSDGRNAYATIAVRL